MAKNRAHERGTQLAVAATDPAAPASGDPILLGQLPGVALADEDADGLTTVQTDGVFNLTVKGEEWTGTVKQNVVVAVGDILYYRTPDTPKINKDNRGVRYGYAVGALASGATGVIPVKLGY